jgi:hypothetical protein
VPQALADYGQAVMNGGALLVDKTEVTVGEETSGILLNMIADDGITIMSMASEEPELQFWCTNDPTV